MTQVPGSTVAGPGPIGPIGGFLERFRRTTGMPARVGDEAAVELAPVFAVLDAFEREAQELRDRSSRMAAQRLHEAEEEAAALAAEARARADQERGDALKAGLRAADVEIAELLAAAEAEARAIRRRGEERLPALVAEVVARVREAPS
jgi:flagellar biosynthesis/type III secretory pathway protein FliH